MPCIARFGTIFVQFKNHEKHPWQGVTFSKPTTFIVGTHPPPFGGEGGLSLQPNVQKGGGLDRTSSFRGGCWERGADFFQGGLQFLHKNKLKSGIFNDKKSL